MIAGLLALTLTALTAAGIAVRNAATAARNAASAERQHAIALSRQLVAESLNIDGRRSAAEGPGTPAATAAQAGVSSLSWYQFLTIAGALAGNLARQ